MVRTCVHKQQPMVIYYYWSDQFDQGREIVGGKMTRLQRALLFSKLFNQLQNIKFVRLAIYCTASRYK